MTNSHDIVITGTGGSTPPATVKVWDLFVRVFHWSLVLLFAIAYLTDDEVQRVHIVTGYAIAGLLGARIVWGFIGPRHARFDDFVHSPRAMFAYVRDALLLRARRYVGHNPAGGLMIVALLVMLTATCISGHMMTTDSYWGSKAMEEIHGALANATVVLIMLHILGVLVCSFEHRENLVKSMVSGHKPSRSESRVAAKQ